MSVEKKHTESLARSGTERGKIKTKENLDFKKINQQDIVFGTRKDNGFGNTIAGLEMALLKH